MKPPWSRTWITAVIILELVLPGILVWAFYAARDGCPVPQSRLQQLSLGMSKDQVALVIGRPSSISSDPRYWTYRKFYLLQEIEVVFSPEGRLVNWHWE